MATIGKNLTSTTPINHSYQPLLSTTPINHSYQPLLSITPINHSYQSLLSTTPINQTNQPLLSTTPIILYWLWKGRSNAGCSRSHEVLQRLCFSVVYHSTCPACPVVLSQNFPPKLRKTIYPFVTKTRQKLIEKVLIYPVDSRGAGSNLGRGGGSISKKGTLFYFGKQAEKIACLY